MESIREIYKIGQGPSSSHTMGPRLAAENFRKETTYASRYKVTLWGSLGATGKGHLTDEAIIKGLGTSKVEFIWKPEKNLSFHPNALTLKAFDTSGKLLNEKTWYSIGGGKISEGSTEIPPKQIFPHNTLSEILSYCEENGLSLSDYVFEHEDIGLGLYLEEVWKVMLKSIKSGIDNESVLPGKLKLKRRASSYYQKAHLMSSNMKNQALVFAYALAVSEENAAGGTVVTAPTCGSCGILPSVLKILKKTYKIHDRRIKNALATAGLIGNLVKHNASISGAQVGCQGEVGTACAMASAAATQLNGGSIYQIEYAAEMGIEHHLGLTCDPVAGLVQIPCIERNAMAAVRAINNKNYALLSDGKHFISFDKVVRTMKETGHDLPQIYKETSVGGLAKE